MLRKVFWLLAITVCLILPLQAYGHGGGTDKDGCHTDKKTGERHCHDGKEKTDQPASSSVKSSGNLMQLDYPGFTVWLDCERRGAVKFRYTAGKDTANHERHSQFYEDKDVPEKCQQTSTEAYGQGYDRGHLVPANHMDYSKESIRISNYMTNVLPQVAQMNRGAWLRTEEIIECYRDIEDEELLVLGGVIWGNDSKDDFFVKSHGVKTPDAFWKVIVRGKKGDQRVIAWIVPNNREATKKKLDNYLVTPQEIEKLIGEKLPIDADLRDDKPSASWVVPEGCDRG